MVKTRIVPKLLLHQGRTVKGVRFEAMRDTGHPVTNARIYDAQGVDELVFLDIDASQEGRGTLLSTIRSVSKEIFMPLCAGGGVRCLEDVQALLKAGADKVAVNTGTRHAPGLLEEGAEHVGAQCMVASIDYRIIDDEPIVFTYGGHRNERVNAVDHARECVAKGAGEVLLTSIDRDGTMEGYDVKTLKAVTRALSVPVIASGGAGTLQHLVEAVRLADVSAVAVGSLFHFTDQSPIKARSFLRVAGVDVRA